MSDGVQDNQQSNQSSTQPVPNNQPVSGGMAKESEMPVSTEPRLEDAQEFQVPKEVANHVQVQPHKPEIPPDLKSIGVTNAPADQTVSDLTSSPRKTVLTDDQINDGLQKPPTDSFRWLAEWCVKQLKLMHVHLTKVNGKMVRVPDKQ